MWGELGDQCRVARAARVERLTSAYLNLVASTTLGRVAGMDRGHRGARTASLGRSRSGSLPGHHRMDHYICRSGPDRAGNADHHGGHVSGKRQLHYYVKRRRWWHAGRGR